MRRIGNKAPVLVVNDALIALEAGAGDGPGIVLIAGTGSICYGRNERGQAARAGGWGYILADEGSGWWMGQRAIQAVMRQADGRGPATSLTSRVLAHFGVTDASMLVFEVYYHDPRRRLIAGLGPAVQASVDEGDAVAREIVADAAGEAGAGRAVGRREAGDARRAVSARAVWRRVSGGDVAAGGSDEPGCRGRAARAAATPRRRAGNGRRAIGRGRSPWRGADSHVRVSAGNRSQWTSCVYAF
jgi:hypothetical protein